MTPHFGRPQIRFVNELLTQLWSNTTFLASLAVHFRKYFFAQSQQKTQIFPLVFLANSTKSLVSHLITEKTCVRSFGAVSLKSA